MLIDTLSEMIREKRIPVFRLAVYENGEEREREFNTANDCNNIYSVSKNFTAACVGILFDRGILAPDTRIAPFLEPFAPQLWKTLDPRWNDVTVHHLLTQTTGYRGMFLDMDCDDIFAYGTDDFLTKALTEPLVYDPGMRFAYSDSNYYLLSRVVASAAGEFLQSFAARELLRPLKIQGWAWSACPHGHAMGGTRLFIRTVDMLHFGRMLLEEGEYSGTRILSREFVRTAAEAKVKKSEHTFYGYSFWSRAGSSSFHCGGMYGQKIFIDRQNGRAAAWQAMDREGKTDALLDLLYSM